MGPEHNPLKNTRGYVAGARGHQVVRLVWQSENPRFPQGLGVLGEEGVGATWVF